jgi:hypothetical protein
VYMEIRNVWWLCQNDSFLWIVKVSISVYFVLKCRITKSTKIYNPLIEALIFVGVKGHVKKRDSVVVSRSV